MRSFSTAGRRNCNFLTISWLVLFLRPPAAASSFHPQPSCRQHRPITICLKPNLITTTPRVFFLVPNNNNHELDATTSSSLSFNSIRSSIPHPDYVDRESYWVTMFYLLMLYKEREGHIDVPLRHVEQGWQLGGWLAEQRAYHKRGILCQDYKERLEDAGVAWNLHQRNWETRFASLQQYQQREGHVRVPQRHIEDGIHLGSWLNTQRQLYQKGQLTRERQQQLEDLGVSFHHFQSKWDQMYHLLKQYYDREGHSEVPLKHVEDGQKLGTWLASQRKFLRNGTLTQERQQRLKAVGVDPSRPSLQWEKNYNRLKDFYAREGHVQVPTTYKEEIDGQNLGRWLQTQRHALKRGILTDEKQQRLDQLGLDWRDNPVRASRHFGTTKQ